MRFDPPLKRVWMLPAWMLRVWMLWLLLVCWAAMAWAADPGTPLPASSILSDQKTGSVLFYNYYRADLNSFGDDTEINITNTSSTTSVAVRFFFVNGTTGAPISFSVLLTPTQTLSLLASNVVTTTTPGYVLAVAVDGATGCPVSHNFLVGSESVKLASGYQARLGAVAFAALFSGRLSGCGAGSTTATVAFNGTGAGYNAAARTLALNNLSSRADGNNHLVVLNRVGGNLTGSVSSIGQLFGLIYDDAENAISFSSNVATCQLASTLGSGFPSTTPSFDGFITGGRSGWMKFYTSPTDTALLGAALHYNPNSFSSAAAFNGSQNLHTLTLTTSASYTVPVSVPGYANAPTIASLSPNSVAVGSPAFTLTVTGSGFTSSSVVRVRGADRTTSFVSGSQLTASIPASDVASAGNAAVSVYNPWFDASSNSVNLAIVPSCAGSYSIAPTSQSFAAAGGAGSVSVTAGTGCSWTATSNASWITITSGASGTGNGSVGYSVGINTGTSSRSGTLTIAGQTFTVSQTAGNSLVVVSNASFSAANGLATESVVSGFGTGLATSTVTATTIPLPTTLNGTTAKVRDANGTERLSPLFFVSPGQITFQIPAGTVVGTATVVVTSGDGTVSIASVQIATVAPGLFSKNGTGQGVADGSLLRIKSDGSQLLENISRFDSAQGRHVPVPIDFGPETDQLFLILYGTGFRFRSSLSATSLRIGGTDAPVIFAGAAPGFVGYDQVNCQLPRSLSGRGVLDIVFNVDGKTANTVQVGFQPSVASISPATPTASSSGQNITVTGLGFQSGLTVTLTSPGSVTTTLSGAQIQGVTTTSFVANATLNAAGTWSLRVNNPDGGQSNEFSFTVNNACGYSINPTSQSFAASGGSGSVTVTTSSGCAWTATGNAAWITVTSGANGNGSGTVNYSVAPNTGAARSGTITIAGQSFTVTQGCNDTVISAPPANQTACPGSQVSFSVTATGAGTLSYQWRKNGATIPGATSSTFTIAAVSAGDAGSYSVVVTGACNSTTSTAATLTVNASPSVTTQPSNQSVAPGATATFTAAASGSPSPSVQWQLSTDGLNFNNISGATSGTLTLTNVTLSQNGNRYRALFTNVCGTVTSAAATLTVGCPGINLNPTSLPDGVTGAAYAQTLTASGGVTPYQFNVVAGTLPAGLSLSAAGVLSGTITQGGTFNFTVRATDANNCSGSRAYSLTVACALDISPKSKSFAASGGPDSVSVIAGAGCAWTAASNDGWITLTGATSGAGNGLVTYTVAANTGVSQRMGTMTIAGQTFTVTQAGVAPNPTPVISSLAPSSVIAGSGAFPLTVNGSNFVPGAMVRVNGNERLTNFISATQLTAQLLATDIAAAGSAQITVVNPAPGGGSSGIANLTITPAPSGFTVSGRITYSDAGRPVPGAIVTASVPGVPPVSSPPTGSNGQYAIAGLATGNYIITPAKSGNINGITAFDAARIMQRLAAGDPFAGIQRKSADTDGNDIVDVADAQRIANFVVGRTDFGQAGRWVFDRDSRFVAVNGNLSDQDFQTALVGDITRNWSPDNALTITAALPVALNLKNADTGAALTLPGLKVSGTGFAHGLTLLVQFPNGSEMRLSEPQIQEIKADSFTVLTMFPPPGLWTLRVINRDGRSSEALVLKME